MKIVLMRHKGKGCTWGEGHSMPTVQDVMIGIPEVYQRAKMRRLIKRGLVRGCGCGCRGDFEITPKGIEFIDNNTLQSTSERG